MKSPFYLSTILLYLLVSCNNANYFSFDNLVEITDYPIKVKLQNTDVVDVLDVEAIGIQGIRIIDEYILLSSSDSLGTIALFDKEGNRIITPFLKRGNGPGEMLYQPFISWMTFYGKHEDLLGLYDFKGNYLEYNLSEIIDSGEVKWDILTDSLDISHGSRYFRLSDNFYFCRKINASYSGYERNVQSGGSIILNEFPNMSFLNSFAASDFNIFSTMILYDEFRNIVVELGSRLNVIHIYSLDDHDFNITLSIGDPISLDYVESLSHSEMPKSYYDGKAYRNCFAGLYLGTTMEELNSGNYNYPKIHIFDYEGNPIAEISLPVRTQFFDIDFENGCLYVVDDPSENILSFDLPDSILKFIKARNL